MLRILNPYFRTSFINKRRFHTSSLFNFYEEPRSGYPEVLDGPPIDENLTFLQKIKLGCVLLKEECKLFTKEWRSRFIFYPEVVLPFDEDVVLKFDGTEASLKKWVVTCDRDYKEGYSTAKLELSEYGTGVFHGILNTDVPKDGKTKRAGYCNMTTVPKYKSFKRKDYYNWIDYNQLILKVRGDGRCYMINLLQKGYYDITWNDANSYVMYTRGGPYWQTIKIPFAKFFFDHKGYVQDQQKPMTEALITNVGITLADKKPGPFRLEIDYIAVGFNPHNFETFAYESYDTSEFNH